MLRYKLYNTDGNFVFYRYYPQGGKDFGTVSINTKTGETAIITPSEDDAGKRYAFKMAKRLKEFFNDNSYKDNGIIAWY